MRDGHLHRTTMRLRQEIQIGRAEPFRPLVGHEKRTQCTKMQIFKSFRQPEVGVWCAEREDVDANRAIAVDSGTDFRSELTQMLGTLRDRRTDRYLNRKQSKKQRHYSVWAREGTAEAKNRQRSTQTRTQRPKTNTKRLGHGHRPVTTRRVRRPRKQWHWHRHRHWHNQYITNKSFSSNKGSELIEGMGQ